MNNFNKMPYIVNNLSKNKVAFTKDGKVINPPKIILRKDSK